MEVIPSTARGGGSVPLHQHNVQEWSHLDSLTGMLEHARVETGHWRADTSTSSQQYGKVVDSRARNRTDGSMQQRQRKQLEVFQAQVPGGSLQVIRTQSVTSTSSWRPTLKSDTNAASDFENLQLSVKPLDLSSQKTKATVGRSGSIGSRRPPSRPRSITSKVDTAISDKSLLPNAVKGDVDECLSEVSRICHKIHEESKNNMSKSLLFPSPQSSFILPTLSDNTVIKEDNINRKDFMDIDKYSCAKAETYNSLSVSDIFSDRIKKADETVSNGGVHAIVTRNKSCSIEDLHNNNNHNHSEKNKLSEGTEMSRDLASALRIRRSLQLPNRGNHLYIPNGNVSKCCQELQDGKALDAIENNATGSEALENIFRYDSGSERNNSENIFRYGSGSERNNSENIFRYDSGSERNNSLPCGKNNQACILNSVADNSGNGYKLAGSGILDSTKGSSFKRHSFVTVESLKEVRDRLRHLNTPLLDDIQHPNNNKCERRHVEDCDDGIVIEDYSKSISEISPRVAEQVSASHMKSYMYGMEAMAKSRGNINKTAGTGSLESRTCNRSVSSGGSRSEEWYSRRKSYGFEQVHSQQTGSNSEPLTFQERTRVESSTDSGIYRSSETVTTPSWTSFIREKANGQSVHGHLNVNSSIKVKQYANDGMNTETENKETEINSQTGGRTIVTLGSDSEGNKRELPVNGGNPMETSSMKISNHSRATNSITSNTSAKSFHCFSEPVTVTIPIVQNDSFNNINGRGIVDVKKLYLKKLSEGSSVSLENEQSNSGISGTSGYDSPQKDLADISKTFKARRELFQKHSTGNALSPDNQIKRHSIAVESKYVREGLNNFNLYDKGIRQINFENMFKTTTNISDLENCTGLNLSNNKYSVPLQKELEFKIPAVSGTSREGSDFKPESFNFVNGDDVDDDDEDDELFLQNNLAGKKHKKVEFCKTEVHFAAEPGRFNIVETDEKPPPNNIRRRRRNSSSNTGSCAMLSAAQIQDAGKTSLPEIRFGDSPYEMKLLGGAESNNTPCQIDVGSDTCTKGSLNKAVHIVSASNVPTEFNDYADNTFTQGNATVVSSKSQDTVEIEVQSNDKDVCSDPKVLQPISVTSSSRPRSILKNGKTPRFFHLGETEDGVLVTAVNGKSESLSGDPETKWGVRLRPIGNRDLPLSSTTTWKSTVKLQDTKSDDQKLETNSPPLTLQFPHRHVEGTEHRKQLKSVEQSIQKMSDDVFVAPILSNTRSPESGRGGMEVKICMAPSWSVAERVRQVEDLKRVSLEARGYSTKVNLVSGKTTVMDSRSSGEQQRQPIPVLQKYQQNDHQTPVCLHNDKYKEEVMHLCDKRSQTASDKGLVVHICKSSGSIHEEDRELTHHNMTIKNSSAISDINSRNVNKTTTILIDLSAVPSSRSVTEMTLLKKDLPKELENEECDRSTGTLRSPSLIMKTIHKSSKLPSPEENKLASSHQYIQAERQATGSCTNRQTEAPVAAPRTKKLNIQLQKHANKYRRDMFMKTVDNNTNSVEKPCVSNETEEDTKEETLVVCNQLAVLRELYLNADISDDSELADEEVRSYMSGGGDEDRLQDVDSCSMVSGSWSRMRPFRNMQHHFHKFDTKQKDLADRSSVLNLQSSSQKPATKDNIQSYHSDLHSKETMASTRSLHPKITSVSLQYEERGTETARHVCDTNSDCDRYQTSFHSSSSSKKENLQRNESPPDFEVGPSPTTMSIKSCNRPPFTPQISNRNSSTSLFTQKHNGLLSNLVSSNFEPERHNLHFTQDKRNYGNLNPSTQKRRTNDHLEMNHTMSLPGQNVYHPETEDKSVLYHNHNKHDYFSKCKDEQESNPTILPKNISLSSVLNKATYKDQQQKKFHGPVSTQYAASISSNSSDVNRRNSNEAIKSGRIKARDEEIKDGHFHVKSLSNAKHKHLDRTFNHDIENETEISDHCLEKEIRASTVKCTSSLSKEHDRSVSLDGRVHPDREVNVIPLYENIKMLDVEPTTKSSGHNLLTNTGETESDILEELTEAADQILQAVVGYTDEESCRASSDEPDDEILQEGRRKRNRCGKVQRPLLSLGTITEAPSSKKQETRSRTGELRSHTNTGNARKSQQITKTRPRPTSSTSSLESLTREISQVQKRTFVRKEGSNGIDNCNKRKAASSLTSSTAVKSASRTARLFQRANSREHLLQAYTSSSEDVTPGVKGENNRKPLVPRCTRSHNSSSNRSDLAKSSKSTVTADSQPTPPAKVRARKRDPDSNKPKDRLPGSSNRTVPLVRKSSGGDSVKLSGGKLHTSRSREDSHQRGNSRLTVKRENTDLGHRTQGGGVTTMEPSVHDKSKRTVMYERRMMGNVGGIGLSSASCVVPHVYSISASSIHHHGNSRTKKKLGLPSSQNKELVLRKAAI